MSQSNVYPPTPEVDPAQPQPSSTPAPSRSGLNPSNSQITPTPAPNPPAATGGMSSRTLRRYEYPGDRTRPISYWPNAEDELMRRRKVRWGIFYVFLLDTLLMPTAIILTFWVPGIAFAAFFTQPILAFTYYSVLYGNLSLSGKGDTLAGLGLCGSLLTLIPLLALSINSILVLHRDRAYSAVVYTMAASVATYPFHFLLGFVTVCVLFQHLGKPITEEKNEIRMESRTNQPY